MHTLSRVTAALACLWLGGCTANPTGPDEDGVAPDAIITTDPVATDPALDAVGALVTSFSMNKTTVHEAFCTATLIAPSVLITAKHCLLDGPALRGNLGFAIGPVASTSFAPPAGPARVIPIASFVLEESVLGGSLGLGSDVAIVHLETPVTDIEPFAVGELATSDVGTKFMAVGYGVHNLQARGDGKRRAGQITLRGIEGKALATLISFEEYHARGGSSESDGRSYYDNSELLPGYEAVTGSAPGDVQLCSGDSGGPLLGERDGRKVVFGVASFAFSTSRAACDFGTVYARFGPAARTMIDAGLARNR